MHYYQHHIGDFIKDTTNLDDHQLATYLRMLWAYYTEEKPFDDDVESIAFAMRSDEKTVHLLLRHFFEKSVDKWHHNRCDREILKYHAKSESASKSAKARWNNTNAMRTHTERNANEQVLHANHKPITNNQINTPDGVDELVWQDWISFRKKRRAPVTDRVVEGLVKEGKIAGMTLNQVLTECVVNGWQSFKGEWVLAKQKTKFDVATVTTPTPPNYDAALRKIEEDSKRAAPIPDNIREKMAELLGGRK